MPGQEAVHALVSSLKNGGISSNILGPILSYSAEVPHIVKSTILPNDIPSEWPGSGDVVFKMDNVYFPSNYNDRRKSCVLFETGATGRGTWLGLRAEGTILRLRAGDGGIRLPNWQSHTAQRSNVAVFDIPSKPLFDGKKHTFEVYISTSLAQIALKIDGSIWGANKARNFLQNQFHGGDQASFQPQRSGAKVCAGEPNDKWPSYS
jgi:hypothetical protein